MTKYPFLRLESLNSSNHKQTSQGRAPQQQRRHRWWFAIGGLCSIGILSLATRHTGNSSRQQTRDYDAIVIVGDSFSDDCKGWLLNWATPEQRERYHWPDCPLPPEGRSTGGRAWPEMLQERLSNQTRVLNLAYSGSVCNNHESVGAVPDLQQQLEILPELDAHIDTTNALGVIFDSAANEMQLLIFDLEAGLDASATVAAEALADCIFATLYRFYDLGIRNFLVFQFFPTYLAQWYHNPAKPSIVPLSKNFIEEANRLLVSRMDVFHHDFPDIKIQLFPVHDRYLEVLRTPQETLGLSVSTCVENDRLVDECSNALVTAILHASHKFFELIIGEITTVVQSRLLSVMV